MLALAFTLCKPILSENDIWTVFFFFECEIAKGGWWGIWDTSSPPPADFKGGGGGGGNKGQIFCPLSTLDIFRQKLPCKIPTEKLFSSFFIRKNLKFKV